MKLYSYWRSSTAFRVRAALNLKHIAYDIVPVDLASGEQKSTEYLALNPSAAVPTLVLDDGTVLRQSLAILDYIDAVCPDPPLMPADPLTRAQVLSVAHCVALDIHPVSNLRVLSALESEFDARSPQKKAWMQRWMAAGFTAIEAQLHGQTPFSFCAAPNIADLCIVAQVYNAERWGLPMQSYPKVTQIAQRALTIPEIMAAHPANQPDAKETT